MGAFAQPPVTVNQKDAQGRKQGPWERTWADSEQLRYSGQFKDDKPTGTFVARLATASQPRIPAIRLSRS